MCVHTSYDLSYRVPTEIMTRNHCSIFGSERYLTCVHKSRGNEFEFYQGFKKSLSEPDCNLFNILILYTMNDDTMNIKCNQMINNGEFIVDEHNSFNGLWIV